MPVFTARTGEDRYQTEIGAPLRAGPGDDIEVAVHAVARAYAECLESWVARWPDQYKWANAEP